MLAPVAPERLLRAVVLASSRGPGGDLWLAAHRLAARALAWWLRLGTSASVFLHGSFANDDAVPGLSDVDLVAVIEDGPRSDLELSVLALRRRRLGIVGRHLGVDLYTRAELEAVDRTTVLDVGREAFTSADPRTRAVYLAPGAPADEAWLRVRPPLGGPRGGWRLLAGPERRPAPRERDATERFTVAWLELQYWWRHAGRMAADPERLDANYMTAKLLAGHARVVAWLDGEPHPATRRAALEWLGVARPEEAAAVEVALRCERAALPGLRRRRTDSAAIDAVLASMVRLTAAVAGDHARHAGEGQRVVLVDGPLLRPASPDVRPLADWRARCAPALPDETFLRAPGDPRSVADLGRHAGERPALLRHGDLLVMAATSIPLRGVQSLVTDPVSFAVHDGASEALFPAAPGWSAAACARRAVDEHRAWLSRRAAGVGTTKSARALGLLLTAARAACFAESLEAGEGRLALTVTAATAELERSVPQAGDVAQAAVEALAACVRDGRAPDPAVVDGLEAAVAGLPAYTSRGLAPA